jgi:hypothetical protein
MMRAMWLGGGTACAVDVAGAVELGGKPCSPPTDSKDPFQAVDCDSHGDLVGHIDLAHTTWYIVKKAFQYSLPQPGRSLTKLFL